MEFLDSKPELSTVATLEECQNLIQFGELISQAHQEQHKGSLSRLNRYWSKRADHERSVAEHDSDEGVLSFNYYGVTNKTLAVNDARKRLRLFELFEDLPNSRLIANPDEYGLTEARLASDRETVEEHHLALITQYKTYQIKTNIEASNEYLEKYYTQASDLIEADVLEPVSLLETPIKKINITPAILRILKFAMHKRFLERCEDDEEPNRNVVISQRIQGSALEKNINKITEGYHGTVGAVVGTKLPTSPEFIESYFGEDSGLVLPNSVMRLQFDATLKPHTPHPFISRLQTVIYEKEASSGKNIINVTARKTDRLAAEFAIRSMIDESRYIRTVVDSNSYETLTGLPSLGKNSR